VPVLDSTVESWLREDLGHRDVTNDVSGDAEGRLIVTEPGVVAGLGAALAVFDYLGPEATALVGNGERVDAGTPVLRVDGAVRDVLRGERVVANVVGHASGVATATRRAVDAAREVDDAVSVAATRKTTPGLRGVEKRAVAAGGGDTHRLTLSDTVMVKDNHVAALGLEGAIERLRERKSFTAKLEAEVERPADGVRAAEAGADIVLFDNLAPEAVREGVEALPAGVQSEASGGIAVDDVPDYAATGVDVISMGSLTHGAASLDTSFRLDG